MAVPARRDEIPSRDTLESVVGPREQGGSAAEPSPFHVSRMLWVLLALSAVFLVSVQFYVRSRGPVARVGAENVAEIAALSARSPVIPVPATDLRLEWDGVSGSVVYLLRVHGLDGAPVVDPVHVWGEEWRPSTETLPGLTAGTYRWSVEAVDGVERVLARSLPMEFEIR